MLSDSESEDQTDHHLTINEHYAKAFEYKKEREELEKLKAKYGSDFEEDDDSETDSESAESEDEDGEELTPAVDAAILRTLARIKRKDPEIYNLEKGVFEEEQKKLATAPSLSRAPKDKKAKPVTLRQVTLETTLNEATSRTPTPEPLSYADEQIALRAETIAALNAIGGDEVDEDDDGLLVLREKTKDEVEKEEEEYRAYLKREVGTDIKELVTVEPSAIWEPKDDEPKPSKKKGKKKKDGKTNEEEDQEFLMNYILNRGWIDRSLKQVPTYKQVTSSKIKRTESEADGEDDVDLPTADPDINEDDFEEIVDRFESSYNFRFEEPEAATIKTFPRVLPTTVRREDTTRKDARARKKERKEAELQKKREEVKQLKSLKMKEIRAKLDRIGKEGGIDDPGLSLQELDLEADWDPDAHDQQMAALYPEDDDFGDEKPEWEEDIDIDDIFPSEANRAEPAKKKKKKKKKKGKQVDEDDGVDIDEMDADIERNDDDEEWDGTEEMRKRKLDEYMDEVYGLDFNDIVGGIPTRFKYIPVPSQNFALTPVEILMATDGELNEYVGLRKYAPYRRKEEERWDSKRTDRLKDLKHRIVERTGVDISQTGAERPVKKRKGKKERMRTKAESKGQEGDEETAETEPVEPTPTLKRKLSAEAVVEVKKKRRRHKKDTNSNTLVNMMT
ncbi:KRI1-like family C-terminal-domain-containing protein [Mycena floridula]|nr:KRI1-like family C-terminal-domain-containing protein [Mycena floridula]